MLGRRIESHSRGKLYGERTILGWAVSEHFCQFVLRAWHVLAGMHNEGKRGASFKYEM